MIHEKVIVSVASWRPRFQTLVKNLQSLVNQDYINKQIILNIHKEDEPFLTEDIVSFCTSNKVFINIIDSLNLHSHNKYYYVMQKYRDTPIITVDDDFIYDSKLVSSLMNDYTSSDKNYIICPTCLQITSNNGKLLTFREMQIISKLDTSAPTLYNWARGGGGVLYPPNILNIDTDTYKEFIDSNLLYDDDCYLKVREINRKISCKQLDLRQQSYLFSIRDSPIESSSLFVNYGYVLQENLSRYSKLFLSISRKLHI